MQNIPVDNTNFSENSSLKCKSSKEIGILKEHLAGVRKTALELESTIQLKDSHVDKVRRDNERLLQELKKQQRTNKSIKQQLDDERYFYQKEKDHYQRELENYRKKYSGSISKFHYDECEKMKIHFENENSNLKNKLNDKSQVIYNLCVKFLRMKIIKEKVEKKLDRLTNEHFQLMSEMMEKLDEAQEELKLIFCDEFLEKLPIDKLKYLQIVKRNSRLIHENTLLKLQIQHLLQTIDKFRNESENSKTEKIDPKTVDKLLERERKTRGTQYFQKFSQLPFREKIETQLYSNMETCRRVVDQSGDANLVTKLDEKHCNQLLEMEKEFSKSNHDSRHFIGSEIQFTQSSPAIVQSSIFQQNILF